MNRSIAIGQVGPIDVTGLRGQIGQNGQIGPTGITGGLRGQIGQIGPTGATGLRSMYDDIEHIKYINIHEIIRKKTDCIDELNILFSNDSINEDVFNTAMKQIQNINYYDELFDDKINNIMCSLEIGVIIK